MFLIQHASYRCCKHARYSSTCIKHVTLVQKVCYIHVSYIMHVIDSNVSVNMREFPHREAGKNFFESAIVVRYRL